MPTLVLRPRVLFCSDFEIFALLDALQFDVGAHAVDTHVVGVVEVVAQVELAEPERDGEAGEVGRLFGRVVEGYIEVGAGVLVSVLYSIGRTGAREVLQVYFFEADSERSHCLSSQGRRHCGSRVCRNWVSPISSNSLILRSCRCRLPSDHSLHPTFV